MAGRYPNIRAGKRRPMIDGVVFDSQAELNRYLILKDEQARGKILCLQVHPHYNFSVNGVMVGRGYTADFAYMRGDGVVTVEEVKGPVERDWPLRRDLFLALYPNHRLMVNGKELKRRTC